MEKSTRYIANHASRVTAVAPFLIAEVPPLRGHTCVPAVLWLFGTVQVNVLDVAPSAVVRGPFEGVRQ